MKPWEAYKADVSIDLEKHHIPNNWTDKVAYWGVKMLRIPTDIFFKVLRLQNGPLEGKKIEKISNYKINLCFNFLIKILFCML